MHDKDCQCMSCQAGIAFEAITGQSVTKQKPAIHVIENKSDIAHEFDQMMAGSKYNVIGLDHENKIIHMLEGFHAYCNLMGLNPLGIYRRAELEFVRRTSPVPGIPVQIKAPGVKEVQ